MLTKDQKKQLKTHSVIIRTKGIDAVEVAPMVWELPRWDLQKARILSRTGDRLEQKRGALAIGFSLKQSLKMGMMPIRP